MSRRGRGPLSDAFKASDNGGRMDRTRREPGPKSPAGGTAPTARSVSGEPAQRTRAKRSGALVREQEHDGSRATGARAEYSPLAV